MSGDSIESAVSGRKVSRRWVLRSTAGLTAGVVAAGAVNIAGAETKPAETANPTKNLADHDSVSGENIHHERHDRHHHWDTV